MLLSLGDAVLLHRTFFCKKLNFFLHQLIIAVDGRLRILRVVESLAEIATLLVPAAISHDSSYIENFAHFVYHSEYSTLLGPGEVGDSQ
jgi:hypothetical protein